MYRLSVPLHVGTLIDADLPRYLQTLRACGAHRVFLCGNGRVFEKESLLNADGARLSYLIDFFKNEGFEVGVWINTLGHGSNLSHEHIDGSQCSFTPIQGIGGEYGAHGDCPMDERLLEAICDCVRRLAQMGPHLIMLDDDFRLQTRTRCYYFGCFCPAHWQAYRDMLGEDVAREDVERLIFTGGENKYRSAYLRLMGDTMLNAARRMRAAIDEVAPAVRLGFCASPESWDMSGTDPIELSRAMAGGTQPFFRTIGAPYWNTNVISVIESTRMQFAWARDTGIEVFAEGDTYPRPRYNVPSKPLELFDLALCANKDADGVLGYLFDYVYPYDYEQGYADRYQKNTALREGLRAMLEGKRPLGVRVFNVPHKLERAQLDECLTTHVVEHLTPSTFCPSHQLLSANTVPTSFERESDYPVMVAGESARAVSVDDLKNGAILDAAAAKILAERGVDTGFLSMRAGNVEREHFLSSDEMIYGVSDGAVRCMTCDARADVQSRFLPENEVASYTYENADGLRFFVLGYDLYRLNRNFGDPRGNVNYFQNYARRRQLIEVIPWLCGRALPAVCLKNPNLYQMCARGQDGSLGVALFNVYLDDVPAPTIKLDRAYTDVRFLNCTGRLEGDTVYLSDIPPYGVAAFEVQ